MHIFMPSFGGENLYIMEYIAVFWLNNILVGTTTQWNGSYQMIFLSLFAICWIARQSTWRENIKDDEDWQMFNT
jgi:hypothetical protein